MSATATKESKQIAVPEKGPKVYLGQPVMVRTNPSEDRWEFGWAMLEGGDVETDGIEVFVLSERPHRRDGLLHVTNPKWKDHNWISDVYNSVQLKMNKGGQWKECQAPEVDGLRKEVAASLAGLVQQVNEKLFRMEKRIDALEAAGRTSQS